MQGRDEDVDVLRGLQELEIQYDASTHLDVFDSDALQMVEATLAPALRRWPARRSPSSTCASVISSS